MKWKEMICGTVKGILYILLKNTFKLDWNN